MNRFLTHWRSRPSHASIQKQPFASVSPTIRPECGVYSVAGRGGAQIESPGRWRKYFMRPFCLAVVIAAGIAMSSSTGVAQHAPTAGPYKVLKTAKVGGEGGFDYISADVEGLRLYVSRSGPIGQWRVFNVVVLDP